MEYADLMFGPDRGKPIKVGGVRCGGYDENLYLSSGAQQSNENE